MRNFIAILFVSSIFTLRAQSSETKYLFKNHKEGYNLYRIPAIIKTASGKLLAFCEGRKGLSDKGDIDLVMKSSEDNGKTWSSLKVIWNMGSNTCGNPTPVFDKVKSEVIILGTFNNAQVYVLRSKDEGISWEPPINITSSVKANNWKWYATGPGHAIQLSNPAYENRIVVPCNHVGNETDKHFSHVIYSDDGGVSWKLGGSVPNKNTDECTVAELSTGELMLNMRNYDRRLPNRKTSISKNGGDTWTNAIFDSTLIEPICQGSLLRYSFKPDIILFSNPLNKKKRKNLTISVSYNNGQIWAKQINIYHDKSAYSDMVVLNNGDVLCLYETGKILPYSGIALKIINKKLIH
jgi:sialidase-1